LDETPRQGFDDHLRSLKWNQGEHVFISGATGSGKTTLARSILERRGHVLAFALKVKDDTITKDYAGWSVVGSMKEIEPWMNRVVLWPKLKRGGGTELLAHQANVVQSAFDHLFKARGWCLFIDELNYMCKFMGVQKPIESLHYIGRSSGISLVTAAQRPAYVPLAVLSNASHAYVGRTKLATDLKRMGDFGDVDPKATSRTIQSLESKHDFLYMPTQGEGVSAVVNTRKNAVHSA
jgi:hypothetical protein